MIWLRLGSVIILIVSAIVVLIIGCILYCFGCLDNDIQPRVRQNAKKVNDFIKKNKRTYNPEKDVDLIDCCICLEEYKSDTKKEII